MWVFSHWDLFFPPTDHWDPAGVRSKNRHTGAPSTSTRRHRAWMPSRPSSGSPAHWWWSPWSRGQPVHSHSRFWPRSPRWPRPTSGTRPSQWHSSEARSFRPRPGPAGAELSPPPAAQCKPGSREALRIKEVKIPVQLTVGRSLRHWRLSHGQLMLTLTQAVWQWGEWARWSLTLQRGAARLLTVTRSDGRQGRRWRDLTVTLAPRCLTAASASSMSLTPGWELRMRAGVSWLSSYQ